MSNFNRLGVYTGHIVKKPGETGVAQITVTDNGKRVSVLNYSFHYFIMFSYLCV